MQKDKYGAKAVTVLLTMFLMILLVGTGHRIYIYYTGPTWTIDRYIKYLQNENYKGIYHLLEGESTTKIGDEETIVNYYERMYSNKIVSIQKQDVPQIKNLGSSKEVSSATCSLKYDYRKESEVQTIQLVKEGYSWRVQFPFSFVDVEVYAPTDALVYIDNERVTHKKGAHYIKEKILPGSYTVRVVFPREDYADYYQIIKVPKETKVVVPYDLVSVEVNTLEGLRVSLDKKSGQNIEGHTRFEYLLPGDYTLEIVHPYGTLEPIKMEISTDQEVNTFKVSDMTLSLEGQKQFTSFMNGFYNKYLTSIKKHEVSSIASYFDESVKEKMLKTFSEWFIDHKEITYAKILVEPSNIRIDDEGYLEATTIETIELANEESSEDGTNKLRQDYKLILTWENKINIADKEWKIIDKEIVESMVCYKDNEGRWVQY